MDFLLAVAESSRSFLTSTLGCFRAQWAASCALFIRAIRTQPHASLILCCVTLPPIGATNSGARPDDRRGAERQGRSAQAVDSSGGSRGRRGDGTLVTPGGGETLERRAWPQ